ncbi:MAG: hypothetical protein E7393_06480 [Ruminococcaceae bacterium]|nr:hypothetical protein [Oscillospiraceae bacterium]
MKKSVYSLVLTDGVVEAADQLAYQKGMSRSALIDEILAQALSCITPEMRMRGIFISLEEQMVGDNVFKLQARTTDGMLSLHSVIRYKYKPTIRYSVELYRQFRKDSFGELKIQSRTQSAQLMMELDQFYRLWISVEKAYGQEAIYYMHEGRLSRQLVVPPSVQNITETALGDAISSYIKSLDRAMKIYFECLSNRQAAIEKIQRMYALYRQNNPILI